MEINFGILKLGTIGLKPKPPLAFETVEHKRVHITVRSRVAVSGCQLKNRSENLSACRSIEYSTVYLNTALRVIALVVPVAFLPSASLQVRRLGSVSQGLA